MWACEQWACEHELWTCDLDFMNKRKSFIECSCHVDIILLMVREVPIAIKKILLPHGKYSYDVAMII
jgi:hypothetical protein